jgi:plasmid stability protein
LRAIAASNGRSINAEVKQILKEIVKAYKSPPEIVARRKGRQDETAEVFTPTKLVNEMLDHLPPEAWEEGKTYLNPAGSGNGQFEAEILRRKMDLGHKNPLSTIYSVDIMPDNIEETRQRLLDIAGDTPENRKTVQSNIALADGLNYDFEFEDPLGGMPAMGNAKNTPAETKAERIAQRNADLAEEHPAKKTHEQRQ